MPWNGSGVFTRQYGTTGWQTDAAAGVKIVANRHDTNDGDLATGINTCLAKDGQNVPTANLPMGGFKHTGVAVAASLTDYARADQVQNSAFTSITLGGTANVITATSSPSFSAYATGQLFHGVATATNTSSVTLQVNGIAGAKAVTKLGAAALTGGEILSGMGYFFLYDGTRFLLLNATVGALQLVSGSGAGGSTTSVNPTFANLISSVVTIIPKSSSSKLLVEVSFTAGITNVAATNTAGTFQLYETSTASPIGAATFIQAPSASGGTGAFAPVILRTVLNSTGASARSFGYMGYTSIGTATCSGSNYTMTILEVL